MEPMGCAIGGINYDMVGLGRSGRFQGLGLIGFIDLSLAFSLALLPYSCLAPGPESVRKASGSFINSLTRPVTGPPIA